MITLKPRILDAVYRHAVSEFPSECCGVIAGKKGASDSFDSVFPCRNLQDEQHAKDPARFPRNAQTAYFMDPKDLFRIQKICREQGMEIKIIYHSHVDVGAYFSEEDKKQATFDGGPVYPGTHYLVVDVTKEKVRGSKLFIWSDEKKDFLEQTA